MCSAVCRTRPAIAEECCLLRSALREATNAFLTTLDQYTVADLLQPRHALARLLQINGADQEPGVGAAPA